MKIKKAEDKPKQIKKAPEQSIKVRNQSIKLATVTGAKIASEQMDGGEEVQNAVMTAYLLSKPITDNSKRGARFAIDKAKSAHDKRIKRKEKSVAKREQKNKEDGNSERTERRREERHADEHAGSDNKSNSKKNKKSSDKGDSDKGKNNKRKHGIKKLMYKAQMVLLMKQNNDNANENKASRWEPLLVQRIVIPVLAFLALGMLLMAAVALPVMLIIAIIYNSPFAIFFPPLESGDAVQTVTSAYVAEFNCEVNDLVINHTGHEAGRIVYLDYEGTDASPSNYYDILAVYMVKHGVGDSATIINDTTKGWIETVVDDMCDYTTSSGTEVVQDAEGNEVNQSVLYVNVTLRDYQDMIPIYGFDANQVKLLENMMSPESLVMLGDSGDLGNGQDSISQAEINQILSNITDETQKKACSYVLSKVGYPYSQVYRDSGDYYDCSSLAYYAWKYAGVDISYNGATTAASEAQGLEEAGKVVAYEELQPGDLIFYSYCHNGRYKNISHVAIYVGDGKVVEAKNESAGVVYGDIPNPDCIVTIGRP